jgi:hypothetical protein
MKQGKTLTELAQEIERIQENKRDFMVPTSKLSMNDNAKLEFMNGEAHSFELNNWSAGQVASFTNIPKMYFNRIRSENPELLAKNVNHGLAKVVHDTKDKGRLVRTIDGKMRAFLSSSYRMLESHDLLETTLPILIDNKFEVLSSEITDRRLYLKTSSPKLTTEIQKGDVVQYGVMISTSDVGAGALKIEPYFTRLVCLNGMIMQSKFKQAHLGQSRYERNVQELLTDRTKELNDVAFFATVRDYLFSTMQPQVFEKEINKMREAVGAPITNYDLEQVVELSMNRVGIRNETAKKGILHALASGNEGAGLNKWGLANSFTKAAQMEELDYETSTELERAGGDIIELTQKDWRRIAEIA